MIYMNKIWKARGTASCHVVNTTILPCLLPHLQVYFYTVYPFASKCFSSLYLYSFLTDAENIKIEYMLLRERQIDSITCTVLFLHVISQNEIYHPKKSFSPYTTFRIKKIWLVSSQFLLFFRLIYIVHWTTAIVNENDSLYTHSMPRDFKLIETIFFYVLLKFLLVLLLFQDCVVSQLIPRDKTPPYGAFR